MSSFERNQKRRTELQEYYELLSEKIKRLREAYVIETNVEKKFQLEKQIEKAEKDRDEVKRNLFIPLTNSKNGDFRHSSGNNKSLNIVWDSRDLRLLHDYLEQCAKYDDIYKEHQNWDEKRIRDELINGGLTVSPNQEGHIYLNDEGILFCCRREKIPRFRLHVHVKFSQKSTEEELTEELFGSVLYLYQELSKRLESLIQRKMGTPDIRDKYGGEKTFSEYPRVAIIEALVNFLIHRDYFQDDIGFITVYPDKIEFINPGKSIFSPEKLLKATNPLRPRYIRNQRLIEAMNKARLNQREGSGIIRIRKELEENQSYLPDGSLGLSIKNNEADNRFILTIYKRRDFVKGVVIGDSNIVAIGRQTVPFLAPPKPPYPLVGRDKALKELKNKLFAGDTIALLALNGLPGVGKTALAVELAHDPEVRKYFSDGVLWAGLGRDADPFPHLGIWMAALEFPDEIIARTQTCKTRQEIIKEKIGIRRMLLVIDDVWMAEDAQWFKIGGPNCVHLLTTRQPEIALDFAGNEGTTTVSELSLEDSITLLKQFVPKIVEEEPEDVKKLVVAAGLLPLALMLIGKYLQKASYSQQPRRIRLTLEQLKRSEERVQLQQLPSSGQFHPGMEDTSISLYTVIAITDEALDEDSRTTLRRLAVFSAKPDTFSEEAALAVTGKSYITLDTLYDYGVLESAGSGRYMIHQTFSDYAALKLRVSLNEEQETQKRHSKYYAEFMEEWEVQLSSGNSRDALNNIETEIANIRLMWKRGVEQRQKGIIQQAANGLENFYWLRGWYQEGEQTFSQAIDAFRHQIEGEQGEKAIFILLAKLMLFQGKFLQALGRYNDAKLLYEQSLKIRKKFLGTEHLEVATSLNEIALLYESQGLYNDAEFLYKQCLEIRQKKHSNHHPDVATALNDLARLYQNQGRYEEAEKLFQQSLKIRQSLETERLNLATSYNNLATLYRAQERNKEAESFYHQALEIWGNILGEEHPYVATALGNLGELYYAQGKYMEAEKLHQQALTIRRKVFGQKHPDIAQSFHALASVALSREHSEEAKKLYKQALSIQIEFLGPGHPTVATTLSNLAYLYGTQGKYKEAERLCQRALEIRRARLNPEHLDIATSLNNLAMLYYRQGKYDDAEPLYQEALAIQKKAIGLNHPTVANLLDHLAALYHIRKAFSQAEQFYQQALEIRKEVFGPNHPAVARSLVNLAWLFQTQGNHSKVKQLAQQALQIANSLENEAERHASQEDYAAAEACYREVLQLKEDILGKSHHKVLKLVDNLALLYYSQGKYQEAKPLFTKELTILIISPERNREPIQRIKRFLEELQEKLRRGEE